MTCKDTEVLIIYYITLVSGQKFHVFSLFLSNVCSDVIHIWVTQIYKTQ